jgi:hypothetical protein
MTPAYVEGDELKDEILQKFDNLAEAREYVMKVGDRNVLATIWG